MVVFTCAHCGESVKKTQVEKHYSITRCRNSYPSLTCVDCLKDFNGEEYKSHTSCVTEAERYSAKGFVPKPPSDKGKKKQENWVHFIRNILDGNLNVNGKVKFVLERVGSDPGLPQKKNKFLNFCKSKIKYEKNPSVFEEAWEFLQKKREEFQKEISAQAINQTNEESGQADRKRKRIDSNNECSAEVSENGTNDVSKQTSECSGKKKKQKQDKEHNFTDSQNDIGEDEANVEVESKKKKKQKKKSSFQNSDVSENVQEYCDDSTVIGEVTTEGANENEMHNLLSKKEKKEKRKKEKYEKQLLEIQDEPVNGDEKLENNNNTEALQNRKKKGKKKCQENGVAEDLNTVVKTSKQKQQSDIEMIDNREDVEQDISGEKPTKFSWEQTVIKLLESKGELPLKRVEKKVVNEYVNSGVHVDSIEKVIAKFNKKILKMSRVKVKKDIVKLIS